METIHQIYDPVDETGIEDKQYLAPAVKYGANTQGQCHMSMQSKTETKGHKGGLLKRTDVHHRLSYIHKFITSVRACAVHSHRLHVSPSWLGCSTIYVHSRDQPQ